MVAQRQFMEIKYINRKFLKNPRLGVGPGFGTRPNSIIQGQKTEFKWGSEKRKMLCRPKIRDTKAVNSLEDLRCTKENHVNKPTSQNNIIDLVMTPDLRIIGLEVTDKIGDPHMINFVLEVHDSNTRTQQNTSSTTNGQTSN
ncbi:hypothetical protein FHG87_015655 [Trinorchestia longiramus]|nr:hypothetical protein FHG87_015655 [Trinorchestia longiramus]